jgi:hypothetical protein
MASIRKIALRPILKTARIINTAGLGTRFAMVLFETYCGQATCSDATRKKVAAMAEAAPGH